MILSEDVAQRNSSCYSTSRSSEPLHAGVVNVQYVWQYYSLVWSWFAVEMRDGQKLDND